MQIAGMSPLYVSREEVPAEVVEEQTRLFAIDAERVARAVVHARATLEAGVTTVRDLGSEGAGYADVGLKAAVDKGVVPGPRMLVAGPAMVVTGSYAPKGFAPEVTVPQGAEEADGIDSLTRVVRDQIGHGADWIKIYADYRWGTQGAAPTFSLDELKLVVETAKSANVPVTAHATTAEGMRRATLAAAAVLLPALLLVGAASRGERVARAHGNIEAALAVEAVDLERAETAQPDIDDEPRSRLAFSVGAGRPMVPMQPHPP